MESGNWIEELYIAEYVPFNEEKVLSSHTDDYVCEDVARGVVVRGIANFIAFLKEFFSAFTDYNVEVISSFASGDRACIEYTWTGTHTGNLPGLPATGKSVSLRTVEVWELREGKISKASMYYDQVTMLQQLGVMPPPPGPR